MTRVVRMRQDYCASDLRQLAKETKNARQGRRLLSLAAVLDGMSRAEAAQLGGMDRQTLRDWVHRFNELGPDGLKDAWNGGAKERLSGPQKAELARIVATGPDPAVDGVVRWRRIDVQRLIEKRFGVRYHERHVGRLLTGLGLSPTGTGLRRSMPDGRAAER